MMFLKKFFLRLVALSLLLVGAFLNLSQAMMGSVEDFQSRENFLQWYQTVPACSHFLSKKDETKAGVFLYSTLHGKVVILFRRALEDGSWSVFEGTSTDEETYLHETAAHALSRQSQEIYAIHPQSLLQCPFVDTTQNGAYFRLYFYYAEHVSQEELKDKLLQGNWECSREGASFRWVLAERLFQEVTVEGSSHPRTLGHQTPIERLLQMIARIKSPYLGELDPQLLKIFFTPMGLKILDKLSQGVMVSSRLRGLNQYYSDEAMKRRRFKIHYPLPTSGGKPDRVPLGEDAYGRVEAQRDLFLKKKGGKKRQILSSVLRFDRVREKETLTRAIAAHGAAMLKMKELFLKEEKEEKGEERESKKIMETLSDKHIRWAIGSRYMDPKTHNSPRDAFLHNVRTYYTGGEFDEFAFQRMADVWEHMQEQRHPTMLFHGASGQMHNLLVSYTQLHRMMGLDLFGGNISLRGAHIYFRGVTSPKDVSTLKSYSFYSETDNGYPVSDFLLCVNRVLTGGPRVDEGGSPYSKSTSSSLFYWATDHSVAPPDFSAIFKASMVLNGMTASYEPFLALYYQFQRQLFLGQRTGVLLTIGLPKEIERTHVLMETRVNDPEYDSVISLAQNIPQKPSMGELLEKKPSKYCREYFDESRVFIHPCSMLSAQIRDFPFMPLGEAMQRRYSRRLEEVTIHTVAEWLNSGGQIMPDAFMFPSRIKTLSRFVMGSDFSETAKAESVCALVFFKHYGPVMSILEKNPHLLMSLALEGLRLSKTGFLRKLKETYGYINDFIPEETLLAELPRVSERWHPYKKMQPHILFDVTKMSSSLLKLVLQISFNRGLTKTIEAIFSHGNIGTLNDYFSTTELVSIFWKTPELMVRHSTVGAFSNEILQFWSRLGFLPFHLLLRVQNSADLLFHSLIRRSPVFSKNTKNSTYNDYRFDGILTATDYMHRLIKFAKLRQSLPVEEFQRLSFEFIKFIFNNELIDCFLPLPGKKDPLIFSFLKAFSKCEDSNFSSKMGELLMGIPHNDRHPLRAKNTKGQYVLEYFQRRAMTRGEWSWILERFKGVEVLKPYGYPPYLSFLDRRYHCYRKLIESRESIRWLHGLAVQLVVPEIDCEAVCAYLDTMPNGTLISMGDFKVVERFCRSEQLNEIYKRLCDEHKSREELKEEERKKIQELSEPSVIEGLPFDDLRSAFNLMSDSYMKGNFFRKICEIRPLEDLKLLLMDFYRVGNECKINQKLLEQFVNFFHYRNYKLARKLFFLLPDKVKKYHDFEVLLRNFDSTLFVFQGQGITPSYKCYYFDFKMDFPEFLEFKNTQVDIFSLVLRELCRDEGVYPELFDFLESNISKLTQGRGQPHLFYILKEAVFLKETYHALMGILKKYPHLSHFKTPDGFGCFERVESVYICSVSSLKSSMEIENDQRKRKKSLLAYLLEVQKM